MTAYFIATIKLKNADKFKEYAKKFGPTIADFGGELVLRGKAEKALAGSADNQMSAIVKFPDMASLDGWFNSAEYQAIIPLRDEGADATIVAYEAI